MVRGERAGCVLGAQEPPARRTRQSLPQTRDRLPPVIPAGTGCPLVIPAGPSLCLSEDLGVGSGAELTGAQTAPPKGLLPTSPLEALEFVTTVCPVEQLEHSRASRRPRGRWEAGGHLDGGEAGGLRLPGPAGSRSVPGAPRRSPLW